MATQPIDDTVADDDAGADAVNDSAPLNDVEQLAADMGWKPKAAFEGPEGKWRPAKDFILKGKEMQDGLRDTVKDLKRTVDQMAATGAKMTERALREQAAEIETRHAEAIENKDARGAAQAVRDMDALQSEAKGLKRDNPEKDFAARNPWYETNRAAKALAIFTSQEEAQKGASIEEQLAAAERAVKAEFPALFEGGDKQGKKAAEVAAPGSRSTSIPRVKTVADLPAGVKTAMEGYVEMFRRKMPADKFDADKIRTQYAKDYWADQ